MSVLQQFASCLSLTAVARSCGIYGGQSGTGNRFLTEYFSFAFSVPFHQGCVLMFILILLLEEGKAGLAWEPSS